MKPVKNKESSLTPITSTYFLIYFGYFCKKQISMIRILTTLFFLVSISLGISAQTSIGGVINSYAKVTGMDTSDPCDPFLSVDDASSFAIGDVILVIQMKGAEMDTTNAPTFGSITNLNSAGLYERTTISDINGNDVFLGTQLTNNYDVNGSLQIVSMPQYENASVDSPITPLPWDGDKGGIIAFEVENILTINANISASFAGFRGGESDNQPSTCNWTSNHQNYFYPDNSPLGDSKGEGIVEFFPGKENGRGPQGTGGGGGNDHNSGGGGGSNFGGGGIGGQNLNPVPLQCLGQYPGIGGYPTASLGNRLFMGGGGGTGHMNDGNGTNGGEGGGIVYIKANIIEGYWNNISAEGKQVFDTPAQDGAGGGGAGGTILLDCNNLIFGLGLYVRGGKGGNTDHINTLGCMGPGGGGGGGVIFTDLTSSQLYIFTEGGSSGQVINSNSACNGESLGASSGSDGILLSYPGMTEGLEIEHIAFTSEPINADGCTDDLSSFTLTTDIPADSYQWQIDNGTGYYDLTNDAFIDGVTTDSLSITELAPGIYNIQCVVEGGCNDVITTTPVTLEIFEHAEIIAHPDDQVICENESFVLSADASGSNVSYQWMVDDGNGFTNVMDNGTYSGAMSNTLNVQANAGMEGYQFQCIATNDCPGSGISNIATITIDPLPVPDFTFYVNEDTLFVQNNSQGESEYYWDFGEGDPLAPGNAPYHIYEEGGTYFVTIYAINDCGTTTVTYPVDIILTSIFETQIAPIDFVIAPNPVRDWLRIDLSGESFDEANIRIYDIKGSILREWSTAQSTTEMDVSTFSAGTYLIQVSIDNESFTKKLVKQ